MTSINDHSINQEHEQHLKPISLTNILDGAWSSTALLTEEEIAQLQADVEAQTLDHTGVANDGVVTDTRLRDCMRCTLKRPELAARVFERIKPHIEHSVTVDGSEESRLRGLPVGDPELYGVWTPCGVNAHIRVCKYPGDGRGHFGPHIDGAISVSEHERSLLTLNGYLNVLPEGAGGRTRFLIDDLGVHQDERGRFTVKDPQTSVRGAIRPTEPGMAAVFYHGLMHDSEPLQKGAPPKWIWRTEVLYKRDPSTAPILDERVKLAKQIEHAAEQIEREDAMASMQLYQLAQRLRDERMTVEAARTRFVALMPERTDADEAGESTRLNQTGEQ